MGIAVITGASSGIGKEFFDLLYRARKAADSGQSPVTGHPVCEQIWVVSRNLSVFTDHPDLYDPTIVRPLPLDLSSPTDRDQLKEELRSKAPQIQILIQCAGLGIVGRADTLPDTDIRTMIDVNCTALTEIAIMALPYMSSISRRERPVMINIASSAGFLPQAGFSVYAATKSYVIHFSRALHREQIASGPVVTALCPGPVDTPFFDKASGSPGYAKRGFKSHFLVKPDKVAAYALRKSAQGRSLCAYGFSQRCLHLISKLLPNRWLIGVSAKVVKF